MRLLILFLLPFVLVACGSNSRSVRTPTSNYCFENPTTRTAVRGGLLGSGIWAVVEHPEVAGTAVLGVLAFKGLDLILPDFGEGADKTNKKSNQILCDL